MQLRSQRSWQLQLVTACVLRLSHEVLVFKSLRLMNHMSTMEVLLMLLLLLRLLLLKLVLLLTILLTLTLTLGMAPPALAGAT